MNITLFLRLSVIFKLHLAKHLTLVDIPETLDADTSVRRIFL